MEVHLAVGADSLSSPSRLCRLGSGARCTVQPVDIVFLLPAVKMPWREDDDCCLFSALEFSDLKTHSAYLFVTFCLTF